MTKVLHYAAAMFELNVFCVARMRVLGGVGVGLLAMVSVCPSSSGQSGIVAEPKIVWATPAALPAGTALGALQLNATANVDGTFEYEPAAGTVFRSAGTQTLAVVFTPKDDLAHKTVRATVPLVVGRTFYVSPAGSDSAGGQTEATPFATLAEGGRLDGGGRLRLRDERDVCECTEQLYAAGHREAWYAECVDHVRGVQGREGRCWWGTMQPGTWCGFRIQRRMCR